MAIADQDARRNDILRQLAHNDNNKNAMSEEAKRLNDKISLITGSSFVHLQYTF